MAVAKSPGPHAWRLKPQATGGEAYLRGLTEPALAGFVPVAGGFSLTAGGGLGTTTDFASALLMPTMRLDKAVSLC